MSQDQQRCVEAGMIFLSKPFVRDDLFRLLDALLLSNTPKPPPPISTVITDSSSSSVLPAAATSAATIPPL
jgi:hypothetical protein